ncbi:hypothetical protein SAMN05443575_0971 [Jatrophihabitans endophyticus]|uniref:Uridine kinase n=1 Tax=Jatrophihabitans endophyticus TaxID=1206085 RepID=A0A1M5EQU7_9ACTN|nr:hypothetical protein [Jatrophihabitans endophyticus]SHF81589.1 hypothetical protein SAMN05443575_0971 [Jatrophihabitans endophyticus]
MSHPATETPRWRALAPDRLVAELARALATVDGTVRVAFDGPPAARPETLADALVTPLQALGRPTVHLRSNLFWRDASLRLEYGREDVESYLGWLDHGALQREVLAPIVERGEYLPSLRDPETDRSTHAAPVAAAPGTVLLVSGELLLGLGLRFDRVVHLTMSSAARSRHTPPESAWTLPAFDEYDATVHPCELADVVVKLDDPSHPAVRGLA